MSTSSQTGKSCHETCVYVSFSDRAFAIYSKQEFLVVFFFFFFLVPVGIYSCCHYPLIFIEPHRQNMWN